MAFSWSLRKNDNGKSKELNPQFNQSKWLGARMVSMSLLVPLKEYAENSRFDVITFINVLDHSALPWFEIRRASQLLRPGGLIYLRFPNGLLHSRIYRLAHKANVSNSLRRFLVFHLHSFTPRYIRRLLHDHGFVQTTVLNSPPSEDDPYKLFPDLTLTTYVKKFIYSIAKCTEIISWRRLLLSTSLEVTAVKPDYL